MAAPNPRDQTRILIRTKLQRPRVSGEQIPRPRFLARLDQGLQRKPILISTSKLTIETQRTRRT